jgi:putative redox protein
MRTEQPPLTAATVPTDSADEWLTVRTGAAGFRTDVRAGKHTFVADEPLAVGGTDAGPTPYDYLVGALGACTAMTIRMYAGRKGWPLEEVVVRLRNARSHAADCEDCEAKPVGIGRLERRIDLSGPLTGDQRRRLLAVADRCPVKQTLGHGIEIVAVD